MTALVQLNLTTNLLELGEKAELERALALAEQTLATHRKVFGEQHVMVAQSERAIARVLLRMDRPQDAIAHADTALQLWIASFGDHHPETDSTRLVRARCDVALGRIAEAQDHLELILGHPPTDEKVFAGAQLELAELIANEDPNRATNLLAESKPYFEATADQRNNERVTTLERRLNGSR
jgi:tetratricopeptide (TPR) repeat protein